MPEGFEKRRTPRVPAHFKVKVDTVKGTFNGSGRDLSEGGIGVFLPKLAPVGSAVEVRFEIPGSASAIEATGEVTYHNRGEPGSNSDWMGIRFVRMDAASYELIRRFVKDHFDVSKPPTSIPPPMAGK